MRKTHSLLVLSALVLTACAEEGSTQTSQQNDPLQQTPLTNPFSPATMAENDSPVIATPIEQPPIAQPPITQPIMQPPIMQPDPPISSNSPQGFTNGANAASANTIWECLETGPGADDILTDIGFYADGQGVLEEGAESFSASWTLNGPYVDFYVEGEYFAQLDNIAFNSAGGSMTLGFTLFDGDTGTLGCSLMEEGEAVADPTVISTTSPTIPTQSPIDAPNSTELPVMSAQGPIVNAIVSDELSSFWQCLLTDGTEATLFLLEQGEGGLITSYYPDGITFSWSTSAQGINLSLNDGNQFSFGTPVFADVDFFEASNVSTQGVSVPAMECELYSLG